MSDQRENAIAEHVRTCEECRAASPAERHITALLDDVAAAVDAAGLSALARSRVAPVLAMRARALFWRRLRAVLAAALLPLPLVIALDVLVLGWVYEVIAAWLPAGVALYFVLSYAAWLVCAIACVYAAIPLLISRALPQLDHAPA